MLSLAIPLAFASEINAQHQPVLNWSMFDFVPGDEIIFEDNQDGERNGEFPGRWDLVNGSVENAALDGENVIMFIKTNTNSTGGIVPLMANSQEDYLPDAFTVEFDAYFSDHQRTYRLLFYDGKNQGTLNRTLNRGSNNRNDRIRITQNSVVFGDTRGYYPGFGESRSDEAGQSAPGWRRVSVSFNNGALKVYLDDARVLNLPDMGYNPIGLTFAYHNPNGGHLGYIRNIRLAKGAVPLYDRFLTDGSIVTNAIRFDVNRSTIRPESMGAINQIVQLMKEHPELRFSVEGHTDSDGTAELNQRLSEERARAVRQVMIEMGIGSDRLTSSGHGQTQPLAPNTSPEGKAQNRRVEFVGLPDDYLIEADKITEPVRPQPAGAAQAAETPDVPATADAPPTPQPQPAATAPQPEVSGIRISYEQFVRKVRALSVPGHSGSPQTYSYPDGSAYVARYMRRDEGTSIMLLERPPQPVWWGEPYKLEGNDAQFIDHSGLVTLTIDLYRIGAMLTISSTTILDQSTVEKLAIQSGLMEMGPTPAQ